MRGSAGGGALETDVVEGGADQILGLGLGLGLELGLGLGGG